MAGKSERSPGSRGRRRLLTGLAALGGLGALGAGGAAFSAASAERRFPPLGEFETVEGVRLHLSDQGPRDAPALVLIHGASGNLRDFGFGFTEELRKRYRVIAIDRPGHGHSERGPSDADQLSVQARLLRGAAAQRGVRRALILGHSFGGAAAMAWALDAPESVAGVITAAGAVMPFPGGVGFIYEINSAPVIDLVASTLMNALAPESYVEEKIAEIFQPNAPPPDYASKVGAALAIRSDTLRYNADDITALKAQLEAMAPRYAELRPPLEILHGRADKVVWASLHAQGLAERAPDARLTLLDGIGHMPHHAAREAVYAAIDRLAARVK